MKDYDAYLFDWDGTLARTTEIWLSELMFCAKQYGLSITPEENARHFGDYDIWRKWGLPVDKDAEFQKLLLSRVQPQLTEVELFEDARTMLEKLKSMGKKLALVTSSQRSSLAVIFKRYDVAGLFDVIVSIEDVKTHKPDPEGINIAIERLGVAKDKALMLGDTDKDLRAANNAGIDALLFYPEAHKLVYDLTELQSHKPKHVVRSWAIFLDGLQ